MELGFIAVELELVLLLFGFIAVGLEYRVPRLLPAFVLFSPLDCRQLSSGRYTHSQNLLANKQLQQLGQNQSIVI